MFGLTSGDHSKNTNYNLFANFKNVTYRLTYIFEIGAKERESSLVIIPNHKSLKGNLSS